MDKYGINLPRLEMDHSRAHNETIYGCHVEIIHNLFHKLPCYLTRSPYCSLFCRVVTNALAIYGGIPYVPCCLSILSARFSDRYHIASFVAERWR
jgi:hypothetical protein